MKSPKPLPPAMELGEVDGFPCLKLAGECGHAAAAPLQRELDHLIKTGHLFVLLDTRDVIYLDSSCYTILSAAIERIRAAGGRLVIVDQSRPVERILKLLNLEALSRVVPTTGQATAYLRWAH